MADWQKWQEENPGKGFDLAPAEVRVAAWEAANKPDYAAPIKDSGGNVTGYHSVTETPPEARSEGTKQYGYTPTDYTKQKWPDLFKGVPVPVPGAQQAQQTKTQTAVSYQGIPRNNPALRDTVYSEVAARAYAVWRGISVEQARTEIQNPENANKKETLIELASQGLLDNLAPEFAGQTGQVAGTQPTTGGTGWEQLWAALQAGAREKAVLEKQKAEQDLALARNADERAQAMLELQQANQKLAEQNAYTNLITSLMGTAASLKGPRNYMKFQQYTSGGRDLISQLFGSTPRPLFGAPSGPIEGQTLQSLLGQLGLAGGTTQEGATQTIPLPHQINPAVWDALGTVGQQLLLGGAEDAGYDPDEFVRQLNAARPQGNASRYTRYSFATP